MKNTNSCPKCQSRDIMIIPGRVASNGVGNAIQTGITVLSVALVNRYVCCSCGYSEEWIKKEDIAKLKKRY